MYDMYDKDIQQSGTFSSGASGSCSAFLILYAIAFYPSFRRTNYSILTNYHPATSCCLLYLYWQC